MKKLLHAILIFSMILSTALMGVSNVHGQYGAQEDQHEGFDEYSGSEFDEYGDDYESGGHEGELGVDGRAASTDAGPDDMPEYPSQCYDWMFSGSQEAIASESCAKQIVEHEIEMLNFQMLEMKHLMTGLRQVIDMSGKESFPEGTKLDLTEEGDEVFAAGINDEFVRHLAEDHEDYSVRVRHLTVERGADVRDGSEYSGGESWRFLLVMETTMDGETMVDVIENDVVNADLNNGTSVQVFDFKGSFGSMTHFLNGKLTSNTETGEKIELKLNASMKDEFTGVICDENFECRENPELEFSNENKITLSQTYSGGIAALGLSKVAQVEMADVGRFSFVSTHGSPEGNFERALVAAWRDAEDSDGQDSAEGCLLSTDSWSPEAVGVEVEPIHSGGTCGPFDEGTLNCEAYRDAHKQVLSTMIKTEKEYSNDFSFEGPCIDGKCVDTYGVINNVTVNIDGYDCKDPVMTDECGGYCPYDQYGVQEVDLGVDVLDETIGMNVFDTIDPAGAWILGCSEMLMSEGMHEKKDELVEIAEQTGGTNSRLAAWNADNLASGTNICEELLDETFNSASVLEEDEMIEYVEPQGGYLEIDYDAERKVEVLADGTELCVRDQDAEESLSDAPLCSTLHENDFSVR